MSATSLSNGLHALANDFRAMAGEPDGISIDQAELQKLVEILTVMTELATNLEIETRCLRDMQSGQEASDFLGEEVLSHLRDMLPEQPETVIRPDFSKGGRS
jgi:hypothetical protein